MTSYSLINSLSFFNDLLYFERTVDNGIPVIFDISLCFKPSIICNTTIVLSCLFRISNAFSKTISFSTSLCCLTPVPSPSETYFSTSSKINAYTFGFLSYKIQELILRHRTHPGHRCALFSVQMTSISYSYICVL